MVDNLNTDKSFREKLENFSVQPPPELWNNIKQELVTARRKKRVAYISWISAAAVVVFAFLAGWYFSNNSNQVSDAVTQEQVVNQISEKEDKKIPESNTTEEITEKILQEDKIVLAENSSKKRSPREIVSIEKRSDENEEQSIFAAGRRLEMQLLKGRSFRFKSRDQAVLLAERSKPESVFSLNEKDKVLVAANMRNLKTERQSETGWKMGMHIAPGYGSQVTNHSESYSNNMTYYSSGGNSNVGGGVSVQYKTSKKMSVETGVYYAQNGQKSRSTFDVFAYGNEASFAGPDGNFDYLNSVSPPAFSNAVTIDDGNVAMNSYAGVIEMKGMPKGAEIAADFESTKNGLSNRLVSEGQFSQVFEFIEIPLYLRYNLLDSKLGLEVVGGINAGLVVGNNAYIDNSFGLQNVGKTKDISTVNVSGTIGVGFNYTLGKHVSLALEPRVNYYLNSLNHNSEVEFRPYRIGLYTGLYYEF